MASSDVEIRNGPISVLLGKDIGLSVNFKKVYSLFLDELKLEEDMKLVGVDSLQ